MIKLDKISYSPFTTLSTHYKMVKMYYIQIMMPSNILTLLISKLPEFLITFTLMVNQSFMRPVQPKSNQTITLLVTTIQLILRSKDMQVLLSVKNSSQSLSKNY